MVRVRLTLGRVQIRAYNTQTASNVEHAEKVYDLSHNVFYRSPH